MDRYTFFAEGWDGKGRQSITLGPLFIDLSLMSFDYLPRVIIEIVQYTTHPDKIDLNWEIELG